MDKLSKVFFYAGIIYFLIMAYVNIESTLHFNATQYVPDGEDPEPIRIAELISDIVSPAFQSLVLIALSYIVKSLYTKEAN